MDLLAPPAALTARTADLLARLRGAAALHPRGTVRTCALHVHGAQDAVRTGSRLLDERAVHEGLVRFSRSAGLPPPLPDVGGVAVRLPGLATDGGPLDLLLSTAWRWVFVPTPLSRTSSSLVPFRTGTGRRVLLGSRPAGDVIDLLLAAPLGPWRPWGRLVPGPPAAEQDLRTRPWVGAGDLQPVEYLRRLRAWSYTASQRGSGREPGP